MRNLKLDEALIYYSNLTSDSTDEWGNEGVAGYSEPEPIFMCLSPNKGSINACGFGASINYDREMVTTDTDCPINEYTRLWIDTNITESHDYEVVKVAKSRGAIRYAIKGVDVNES